MKRMTPVILIIILVFLITAFFFIQYIFNIYEVIIKVEPDLLYADNQSKVELQIVPLNSLGWKAPLRKSPADFEIIEGESLVETEYLNNDEGKLILKAKSETGNVVVKIKSEHSLFPLIAEIPVHPNIALNY